MLTNTHLYQEINEIEKTITAMTDEYQKAVLKCMVLNLKLTHNNRTNLVAIIKSLNSFLEKEGLPVIGLEKPIRKDETENQ